MKNSHYFQFKTTVECNIIPCDQAQDAYVTMIGDNNVGSGHLWTRIVDALPILETPNFGK